MRNRIAVIGGGIAGLATAISLKRIGVNVTVFEGATSIKPAGAGIGLGANAIMAFKKMGIAEQVIRQGRILPSFTIYDSGGNIITKTNTALLSKQYGIDNFTIHRAALHQVLLSNIDSSQIILNKKACDFIARDNSIEIIFEDGSTFQADYLIVADGIHSKIRRKLLPDSIPRYSGYSCWRGIADNENLNLNETSETWGRNGRFGIVPLAGNKIYWFACINWDQNNPNFKKFKVEDLLSRFGAYHESIVTVLKNTKNEDLIWNDIIDLKPINNFAFGNVLLIGDAAHATTPNMGQGACQAIEDAVVLADEIKKYPADIRNAFLCFEKRRIKRTHYITNTSWKIGKMAQWDNEILCWVRNSVFKLLPESFNEKQLRKLYEVDF